MRASVNDTFTRVGAGTPMGGLLRRYWHPVAAVAELDDHPVKPVRLMGEDLVLYRDLSGRYGLVGRQCAHRSADLTNGHVEQDGIRCAYHGWRYDHTGQCVEQPFEEMADPATRMKDSVRIAGYKVEALAGMLWAYLGPEPAPLVPNWEPFTWKNGFVQVVFAVIPCNWFQCQENSIDPIHFEWTHANARVRLEGRTGPYSPKHVKLGFDEFDYGYVYRRVTEAGDETDELWKVGRVCLWPNALFTSNHFEWRVPIDDTSTLSVTWHFSRLPKEREPYVQERIPYWGGPLVDPQTGRWIMSHIMNQDFAAWVGQGPINDRTKERLGKSDAGIIEMRRRLLEDLDKVAAGGDPKATIRDPEMNKCVPLPVAYRKHFIEGMTMAEMAANPVLANTITPRRFVFQYGQPEAVIRAYEEAAGFPMDRSGFVAKPL